MHAALEDTSWMSSADVEKILLEFPKLTSNCFHHELRVWVFFNNSEEQSWN